MRKLIWSISGILLALAARAVAQEPAGVLQEHSPSRQAGLASRIRVSNHPFEVTTQAGPWMICAATYTGPEAAYLAEQVVQQLRQRGERAYLFNYADFQRLKEMQEFNERMKNNPNLPYRPRYTRIEGQCGVLIGGYPTQEKARDDLRRVKHLPPPTVKNRLGEEACDRLVKYGENDNSWTAKAVGEARVNPFERSFVIRNPVLPKPHLASNEERVDPAWKNLNKYEPFSLLKCKKTYTLVIKVYQGGSVITDRTPRDEGFLAKFGIGSKAPDLLQAAGMQAHELARFLRNYNFETYVLHTRQGSIVTVGGFDNLEGEDFRLMQQKLASLKLQDKSTGAVNPIFELLPNPMPMRVPRL